MKTIGAPRKRSGFGLGRPSPVLAGAPAGQWGPSGMGRARRLATTLFILGLVLTTGLSVGAELSYRHNQQRLTELQAKLTALLLGTTPTEIEATLGRSVGLAAEAAHPAAAFGKSISASMAPKGPFASSTLALVRGRHVQVLAHFGTAPLRDLVSAQTTALLLRASVTSSVITARVEKAKVQKLAFLISARGSSGVFVGSLAEELRAGLRVKVPVGNPDANLKFALYFGTHITNQALIETDTQRVPLTGTVSRQTAPFGDNVLTLTASPRGSLAGAWSEWLPWAVLVVGALVSLLSAFSTERLLRGRALAESAAVLNREWYRDQRALSEQLQRSLLPRELPPVPGAELAARYVPSSRDTEIGGDWYGAVPVSDGKVAFIIGDVSGHDVNAAGIMAALRYSTRTLARIGLAPGAVLERANAELDTSHNDHFATALAGLLDTRARRLTLASAGHLPPLILSGDEAFFQNLDVAPPIGAGSEPFVPDTTVSFAPGAVLVAFTDGLVENRTEDIEAGLRRLSEVAQAHEGSLDELLDHILAALVPPNHEDDIALLAIRLTARVGP